MNLKKKINLSILFFGFVNLFIIVYLIYPLFSEIEQSSQDWIFQRKILLSFETKLNNLEAFRNIYPEIQANLEKITNLFVNPDVPVGFISFLETTAEDCQVAIEISSGFPSKVEGDLWPSLSFQIISLGSLPNFLKFLERLESGPYLLEIHSLNISKLTEADFRREELRAFSPDDIRANLLIKTFIKGQ